ncbi:MAG: hypothetical protein ABIY51_01560 [Ferruginibacter sp.]
MNFITGTSRHQTYFATLDYQVATDNPVRLIDAFYNYENPLGWIAFVSGSASCFSILSLNLFSIPILQRAYF